MCAIIGRLTFDFHAPPDAALIRQMLRTMDHRGPDDTGIYSGSQVTLGHNRLSIIDLSSGHQPLSNEDGSVWIVFNGEIYNYRELRSWLERSGHIFRTKTDTETIVHLYEEFGPECVRKLRGMFAFAIWDDRKKTLFIARDRVGIKPLYYHVSNRALTFASEIKALLADPGVEWGIDAELIDRFLTFHYLPGEETLNAGVKKLPPGCYLLAASGQVNIQQYWDLEFSRPAARRSVRQAADELDSLLSETVSMHMIGDVPIGVLLSGGVDSTAMLSYAMQNTDQQVNSYTVGFAGGGICDERPYAKMASTRFGSTHHEITISAREFAQTMPQYVWHMEEPVCEPPAIALYHVSRLARNHVKVLLSGEGGDEAFAGYSNYRNLLWLERLKRASFLRNPLTLGLQLAGAFSGLEQFSKYAPLMASSFPEYYGSRTTVRNTPVEARELYTADFAHSIRGGRTMEPLCHLQEKVRGRNVLDAMLYIDTKSWLPDDLLIKADKITMAHSLELRVPLLDHQVLEFAAALPPDFKVRGFSTKYVAKMALQRRVPAAILNRSKKGFPLPYEGWLGGELRHWVRDILLDRKTTARGYFQRKGIEQLLAATPVNSVTAKRIFSLVTLELWHRAFIDAPVERCSVHAPAL